MGEDEWEGVNVRDSAYIHSFHPGAARIWWHRFVWFLAFSSFSFWGLSPSGFLGTAKSITT